MVTICLQCGDKGFANALVYCVKCLEFAVHRYCLDELPDTFDEFVYWVCDDCEVEVPQLFNSLNSEPIQLENGDYINLKHVEPSFKEKSKRRKTGNVILDAAEQIGEDVPSEQSYKLHAETKLTKSALLDSDCPPLEVKKRARDGASPIAKTKERIPPRSSSLELDDMNNEVGLQHLQSPDNDVLLRKMKTKESAGEFSSEIFMQRLECSPREQPCQAYTENYLNDHADSAKLEKKHASPLEAENKKHKKKKKNKKSAGNFSLSENSIQRIGYILSERPCESYTENNLNERKESTELEKEKASLSDAKMEYSGHQSCVVNTELEVTVTGNQVVEFSPLNKTNKKKKVVNTLSTDFQGLTPPEDPRFGPGDLSENATLDNYELAQPLADPIWRGSFNILNKEYDAFEGMVAHLSKKACQKAYEEACLFPTLLDLEMHPKLDVWPKSFETSDPSDNSIALYFFPEHKRYERMFDHLIEQMLNYKLAMKAILENAELLVFTSTELPLNYWRFQGKYYLWGVFRAKQPPSAQPSSNNHVGVEEDSKYTKWKSCDGKSPLSNCSLGS